MKHAQIVLVLSITLLLSLSTQSQPLESVIVTGLRIPVPTAQSTGAWSQLSEDHLNLINSNHIQEALERLPGVNMHRNNGQEYLPAIRSPVLTGSGACGSFLMAEDGISIRPAGFCNVNELFEAHSEQASRIEVLRGPGGALFGSNAMHGVINIISPAALNAGNSIAIDVGPNDFQRVRSQLSNEYSAVAITASHDGGYRDVSGTDQQKISLKHKALYDNVVITSGLTAVNLNQETAGYIVGKDAYKDRVLVKTNPNPEAYRDAWALRLWSRFEEASDKPSWVITPYARSSGMAFLQHFLPGTPLEKNGQISVGLQNTLYHYGDNFRLIAGLDVEWAQGFLHQNQAEPTQGSPFLQATIPTGDQYDYEVESIQASPFVQWQWMPSAKTTITTGLRYEFMQYDYDNLMLDGRTRDDGTTCGFGGCRYSRPADGKNNFNNWSPTLGLQSQLTDNHQLSFTVARGFRAPQTSELYRLQRDQQVTDLKSEQLDSIELGLRGGFGNLSYEVITYAMRKNNVIFRDSDFFTVSDGETKHYGLELAVNKRITETLDITLAATNARHIYTNHRELSGIDIYNNYVDTAPRYFGSVQMGWQVLPTLHLELDWEHMGSYYTDPANLHAYKGHDIFNIRGRWKLSNNITISGKLLNLFDAQYAKRADYSSFVGDRYFPGRKREVYLGIELAW